jgi:hemin uptake protein HemP
MTSDWSTDLSRRRNIMRAIEMMLAVFVDRQSMTGHDSPDKSIDSDLPVHETAGAGDRALRTISSAELFLGAREILIQHEEKTYRLQVTRNGKLILVK